MRSTSALLVLQVAIILFINCSDERPFNPIQSFDFLPIGFNASFGNVDWQNAREGSLTLGFNGPNKAIVNENASMVNGEILNTAFYVIRSTVTSSWNPGFNDSLKIDGAKAGYAVISGTLTGDELKHMYNFRAIYHEYSPLGEYYLGGRLEFRGEGGFVPNTTDSGNLNAIVNGALEVSGDYYGLISFDSIEIKWSNWRVSYKGYIYVLSSGNMFKYYLNFTEGIR